MIQDCVERYLIKLSCRAIECCVGDEFALDNTADVSLIELQFMELSTTRNQKPSFTEKRQLQREKKRMAKRVGMKIS